jgi:hypothetical protein
LSLISALAIAFLAPAPQDVKIPDELPGIDIVGVLSLPDSSGASNGELVFSDSRGRYYQFRADDNRFFVFDASARYVSGFGRTGRGPGELSGTPLTATVGFGDTVHVFEWHGAHTVLAPGTHAYVRRDLKWRIREAPPIMLNDGRMITIFPDTSLKGLPSERRGLAILDPLGRPEMTFGMNEPGPNPFRTARFGICPTKNGTFWAMNHNSYRVEEWDGTGHLRRTLTRQGLENNSTGNRLGDSELHLSDCRVDSQGLLWIIVTIWRTTGSTAGKGVMGGGNTPPGKTRATLIEVIDPERGILVASQRAPRTMRFMNSGKAYAAGQDKSGEPTIQILALRIRAKKH